MNNKMKSIYIYILLHFFSLCCFSQKYVHGYIEIQYDRNEIENIIHNKEKADRGESHKLILDYKTRYICYIIENDTNKDSLKNKIINEESAGEDVVFLIQWLKPNDMEITDTEINVINLPSPCTYYIKKEPKYIYKGQPKYIYRLYEVEGWACDVKLETSEMFYNEEYMGILGYEINYDKPFFTAYYFYDMKMAECVDP